ncbi:MAG: hypothetical protein KF832_06010 [Caldilineaceae bacterium]|nr:hypothetical protein [Caldilineaceae bacterium]
MRVIVVGCEYSGVTTLIEGLMAWGHEQGIHHHLDDHFTIPDSQNLAPADAEQMLNLTPLLKERFQRFQIVYHVRVMHRYEHILLGGFHIEEEIYGPLYYYPGVPTIGVREYEVEMPPDTILVHLTARPEVILDRMQNSPHLHTLIQADDVPMLLARFHQKFRESWIKEKIEIDTSDLTPAQLLQSFLVKSLSHLSTRDLLTRFAGKLLD